MKANLPSSTRSLFSDNARCFSQSECALYGNFIIILLIQYCAKVMQKKFVEIRPLFLRLFYEIFYDISKGSKRKNHALPRKFERTKFEVANFPGNQTKNRDTKFKAANCCDMNRS